MTRVPPPGANDGERRSRAAVGSILRRPSGEATAEKAALGFRICEVILCLISSSVMAANKNQGWSVDSFGLYKEYRYWLTYYCWHHHQLQLGWTIGYQTGENMNSHASVSMSFLAFAAFALSSLVSDNGQLHEISVEENDKKYTKFLVKLANLQTSGNIYGLTGLPVEDFFCMWRPLHNRNVVSFLSFHVDTPFMHNGLFSTFDGVLLQP